jgi:hypothetical protein
MITFKFCGRFFFLISGLILLSCIPRVTCFILTHWKINKDLNWMEKWFCLEQAELNWKINKNNNVDVIPISLFFYSHSSTYYRD